MATQQPAGRRKASSKRGGSARGGGSPSPATSAFSTYLRETRAPLTAAALTLPLVCIYGIGSLVVPEARNGADVLTTALKLSFEAANWGGWRPWAGFYGGILLVNLGILTWLGRRTRISLSMTLPLLLECTLYAVCTGTAADWLTEQVLGVARAHLAVMPMAGAAGVTVVTDGTSMPALTGLIISAGAGLHEEFIFRLVGIGLIARLFLGPTWRKRAIALVVIATASSLAFAAVHHLVEPFTWSAMIFRTVAGLGFAALYLGRGFAVAAWTHVLYDVWILVILSR